jgi:CheY-like chemotaxis protein
MPRKILLVEELREPSLHIQLAVMGFLFDSACEAEAIDSVSGNEYDFVLIEATEQGIKIAQAISELPLPETRLRPPIIGIKPMGMSLAATEALPAGIVDIIPRPIRTDVLYESLCCVGTSLEPEQPPSQKTSSVNAHISDQRTERSDNRDQSAASNASCSLDSRDETPSARGWQRSPRPPAAHPASHNGMVPAALLPLPASRAARRGAARGTSPIWRGQTPPSAPLHHFRLACLPATRAEGAAIN